MSSTSPERSRVSVLLLAAVLLALGGACTRVKIEDTQAEFIRSHPRTCGDADQVSVSEPAPATRTMDTFMVELLELDHTAAGREPDACAHCASTGQGCRVMLRNFYCGGPTTALPKQLQTMMSGTRLGVLDYGELYCLRVIALDRSSLQGDPPRSCDCSDSWIPPALPSDQARLCAVSSPYSAGPLNFMLDVQCPSDGSSFTSCIGAPAM